MTNIRRSFCLSAKGWAVLAVSLLLLAPALAQARAGTHSWAVSTWDTTRSSVVVTYAHGFILEGGSVNTAGYNANFTSTTGRLSAQFGLHYVGLHPDVIGAMHGIAGSAVAVYGIPIGTRFDNGMPRAAFTFFGGSVPTAVFNGKSNYITIPINLGFGIEVNPIKWLSITPWFEFAPSFNLDTAIYYDRFQSYFENIQDTEGVEVIYNPDGTVQNVELSPSLMDDVLNEAVDLEFSFALRMRGGLSLVANLGDKVDLIVNGAVAQLGEEFDAKPTMFIGGALAFAWDDAPESILPEERRLKNLSCSSVEKKFETCAAYQQLIEEIRKEERARLEEEMASGVEEVTPTPLPENVEGPPEPQTAPEGKPLSPTAVGVPAPVAPAAPAAPASPDAPASDAASSPVPAAPSLSEPLKK